MCRSRRELSNENLVTIYLQKSVSMQPRTSPSKFGGKFNSVFTSLLSRGVEAASRISAKISEARCSVNRLGDRASRATFGIVLQSISSNAHYVECLRERGWSFNLKLQKVTVAHVAPPIVNFLAKHPAVEKHPQRCLDDRSGYVCVYVCNLPNFGRSGLIGTLQAPALPSAPRALQRRRAARRRARIRGEGAPRHHLRAAGLR